MHHRPNREAVRYTFLLYAIGFGVVLLWVMLAMAYGPSAAIFGIVFSAIAFALIVRRYRFSLRTFLLVVTVLSVWLGLKANRDVKMSRALSGIENSGGRLEVCDRQPNFPWGLWKYRYRLDFYGLKEHLSEQDFSHLKVLAPSSLQWLNLANTGVTDKELKFIEELTHLEYLSLANETYTTGEVIPDRPQNNITDAGLARLGQLKNLKGIDLGGTDITDHGLKLLSEMPTLEWIYLDGTKVTGPGIAYLISHKDLRMLELNGCTLTPIGYQNLIQLPNLVSLGLRISGTTDAELRLLNKNSRLGILRLNNNEVSDEAANSEVAPICRTLPMLSLAVRLKHKGACHGKECDSREASCAASVQ